MRRVKRDASRAAAGKHRRVPGVGSALVVSEIIRSANWAELMRLAQRFVEVVRAGRG